MEVIINQLPTTLEEFKAMEIMDLTKPENTCALFLCALNLYTKDKNAGIDAVNILKGPVQLSAYEKSFIADRLRDKLYLPLVYFEGATPENNYTPNEPFTLKLYPDGRPQDMEEGYLRLYLQTAGADSKRAIKMRSKGDEWFIWEYPGIVTDVRMPHKEDPFKW